LRCGGVCWRRRRDARRSDRRASANGDLLAPYRLGWLELPNRLVMALLTCNRVMPGNVHGRSFMIRLTALRDAPGH
jgi:hypothetical protein